MKPHVALLAVVPLMACSVERTIGDGGELGDADSSNGDVADAPPPPFRGFASVEPYPCNVVRLEEIPLDEARGGAFSGADIIAMMGSGLAGVGGPSPIPPLDVDYEIAFDFSEAWAEYVEYEDAPLRHCEAEPPFVHARAEITTSDGGLNQTVDIIARTEFVPGAVAYSFVVPADEYEGSYEVPEDGAIGGGGVFIPGKKTYTEIWRITPRTDRTFDFETLLFLQPPIDDG